jgi:hypothetical protein
VVQTGTCFKMYKIRLFWKDNILTTTFSDDSFIIPKYHQQHLGYVPYMLFVVVRQLLSEIIRNTESTFLAVQTDF